MHGPRCGLIAIAGAIGCSPSAPSPSEARDAFIQRRPKIEAFEDALLGRLGLSTDVTAADLEPLVVNAGALGFAGSPLLPDVVPCVGGEGPGTVDPEHGFSEGDYAVGYGLYQTAWETGGVKHGDGDMHPGIVVRWRLADGAGPMKDPVTLCMLIDGTPRPP